MKLFKVGISYGVAVVVSETAQQALQLVLDQLGSPFYEYGKLPSKKALLSRVSEIENYQVTGTPGLVAWYSE